MIEMAEEGHLELEEVSMAISDKTVLHIRKVFFLIEGKHKVTHKMLVYLLGRLSLKERQTIQDECYLQTNI